MSHISKLLEPKSIILGVAILNFALIHAQVQGMEGRFCYICPWYIDWSIAIYPHLLLIAAFGLRLSRWWGYILGVVASSHTFYSGVAFVAHLVVEPNDSWMILHRLRDFLLLQYILGSVIFCYATSYLGRTVYRHRISARHGA
jgi:hypothetical protein